MIKVFLIRHSLTQGNMEKRYVGITDEGLCFNGISILKDMSRPDVDIVFTSPMKRCIETSDILYKSVPKIIVNGLKETDFGDFEYKNYEELKDNSDYINWMESNGSLPFPNGESFEDAYNRSNNAFNYIIKETVRYNYKNIAIVTHGGTIMSIMDKLTNHEKEYYDWQIKNSEYILLELEDNLPSDNFKLKKCRKITG